VAGGLLNGTQFYLHLSPVLFIEGRERLVEQEEDGAGR